MVRVTVRVRVMVRARVRAKDIARLTAVTVVHKSNLWLVLSFFVRFSIIGNQSNQANIS